MTGKKSISIKHFLRISLAVMLLFLFIISALYSLFIYTFSKDQFESSFQTFSESVEAQLDSQFRNVEQSVTQLSYLPNMQEILFSKKPLVYLNNISGCNQLWGYLKTSLPIITEVIITSPTVTPFIQVLLENTAISNLRKKFSKTIRICPVNRSSSPFLPEMIPINYLNWSIAFLYIILCFQVTFLMSTH